ncbi:hypothetical protein [Scytonema sp. NUACC26]|uniref:hypothetical protein n=1 Tax=Scytonema sp. NUACC26 TaxID=3140176 RepID=UPI0034DBD1F6
MKKLFGVISSASLILSVGLSSPPAAHAESRCRNATIAGSFGILTTGTLLEGAPGQPGSFASNGLINFDGNGNLSTRQTLSLNGTIVPFKGAGTYAVEQDCTLTAKFTDEISGAQITITGIIVKRNTEIQIIETDPYTVVTGTLKKVE